MQALILAGGKGTRLRPLTVYTPKPIVPVLNRPLLRYQIAILAKAGITDITLSLSYQPDKIQDVLGDGSELGVSLRYLTEPNPLGTAGAFKFAAGAIRETTVVFNGDILTDVDIASVVKTHKKKKADATIVLVPVEDPSRFGLVETGKNGEVLRFLEKPSPETLKKLKIKPSTRVSTYSSRAFSTSSLTRRTRRSSTMCFRRSSNAAAPSSRTC
jgi:NDP-sugar pyrophosphorylase family protein